MKRWIQALKKWSIASLMLCASLPAKAFVLSNGDEVQCDF